MLSRSTSKYVRSLRQQKYRQKYHKIVVEGIKSVDEILTHNLLTVDTIFATDSWTPKTVDGKEATIDLHRVSESEIASISSFTTPQQVLAVCEMPDARAQVQSAAQELCMYLDGIRDPGNAGTIFRIADWFGIRTLFMSADCVDPYNPKVIQASMGSLFRIQWAEAELNSLMDVEQVRVFATTIDGEDIYQAELSTHGVIVLGNESSGIRNLQKFAGIQEISIPSAFRIGAESLNVAVAAGIICAEFRRRGLHSNTH